MNGQVLQTFGREDAVLAYTLQMGLIWIYNIDYSHSADGKPLPEIRDYIDFGLVKFWKFETKEISSGTGLVGRNKAATKKGCALWKKVMGKN